MKESLNIGCGADYREDCINLDSNNKIKTDICFDLNGIYNGDELPFRDNAFERVLLLDVLEHFPDPLPILREAYRVCQVRGQIEIKVPNGSWVWDNLDHKHQFSKNCFNVRNFDDYSGLGKLKVELEQLKIYIIPSRNIFYRLGRWLFKNNIHVIYKKIK